MKIHHLPDEKSRALKKQNLLYTKASTVTDELFQTLQFFDPRDLLQVKYEMVRRVLKDGWSVSRSAAAFGFSRISYYRIQHAFQTLGVLGLMPRKRGPSHPTKITEAVLVFLRQRLEQQPALSAAKLKALLAGELGVRVHTRTIERALRGKKKLPRSQTKSAQGKTLIGPTKDFE
jgi:transposase